jgi:hypothetical protein
VLGNISERGKIVHALGKWLQERQLRLREFSSSDREKIALFRPKENFFRWWKVGQAVGIFLRAWNK